MKTLSTAERATLENAAERAGAEFRDRYSGRGMFDYGKGRSRTCVGIVGGLTELLSFIYQVTRTDEGLAAELTGGCTSDSMGKYDTIYYWPGVSTDE